MLARSLPPVWYHWRSQSSEVISWGSKPHLASMSVSFKVKDGLNVLAIGLVSPSPADETVQLTLDGNQIAMVTVRQHSGPSTININGTKASENA